MSKNVGRCVCSYLHVYVCMHETKVYTCFLLYFLLSSFTDYLASYIWVKTQNGSYPFHFFPDFSISSSATSPFFLFNSLRVIHFHACSLSSPVHNSFSYMITLFYWQTFHADVTILVCSTLEPLDVRIVWQRVKLMICFMGLMETIDW